MVPIAHEQNIICSKTRLDGTTHEQTIICGQLFSGHVVGSRPIKRKTKMHRMIIANCLLKGNFNYGNKEFFPKINCKYSSISLSVRYSYKSRDTKKTRPDAEFSKSPVPCKNFDISNVDF